MKKLIRLLLFIKLSYVQCALFNKNPLQIKSVGFFLDFKTILWLFCILGSHLNCRGLSPRQRFAEIHEQQTFGLDEIMVILFSLSSTCKDSELWCVRQNRLCSDLQQYTYSEVSRFQEC